MIEVIQVRNPLDRADQTRTRLDLESGATLDMVVRQVATDLPARNTSLAVSVDGAIYPAERWGQVVVMPGQQVTIIPVLHGGGGGDKAIIRIVAMVVVSIVSFGIGALANAGLLGYSAAALAIAQGGAAGFLASAAIFIGGSLLVNALIPPARPQLPALNGYGGMDQSNSYSWSPSTTQQQGTVIPANYGVCKLTGNVISTHRESIGDKQYLMVLISLGEGPLTIIYDIKINDQPASNYSGLQVSTRLGQLNQSTIPWFNDTKTEYVLGIKAISTPTPADGQAAYTTIGSTFGGLEVEVTFPVGIFFVNNSGSMSTHQIQYSVEISPSGANTWQSIANTAPSSNVSYNGRWSAGKWVTYPWPSQPVWQEVAAGSAYWGDHTDGEQYQDDDPFTIWRWFSAEIAVLSGDIVPRITAVASQRSVIRHTWRADSLAAGKYDIRVRKLSADCNDPRYGDDIYLTAVREIAYDDFQYPGEVLVGIRGLATEDLSGNFRFECKTTGKRVRVYRDGGWHTEVSTSPAWVAMDILTQPIFDNSGNPVKYRGYDAAVINLTHFRELADYCAELVPNGAGSSEARLTWNGPFDSAQSMWDAALAVLAAGRATPYWRGNLICLAIDKPAEPSATFSVGNILKDSFKESWLRMEGRAGRVEVDFLNVENGLERDKLTVVNHQAPAGWGVAKLPMQGCIRSSEVIRRSRYHLNNNLYLTRSATLTCDVDALPVTMGSVVKVQHDVMMVGQGGRISSATSQSVTLDQIVTIDGGVTYQIDLVTPNGMISRTMLSSDQVLLASGDTVTRLQLTAPFDVIPDPYTVYAFGPPDTIAKLWRVVGIKPAGELRQEFSLAEYNATIYNSDYDLPVLPTPRSAAVDLPQILPVLSERMVLDLTGLRTMLDISWPPVSHTLVRYIEVYYRLAGQGWQLLDRLDHTATGASLQVTDGKQYQVIARSLDWFGTGLPINNCVPVSITIIGKTAPPADVTGLVATTTTSGALRLDWQPVPDLDIDFYQVAVSATGQWNTSLFVLKAYSSSITLPAAISGTYMVKAVDTSGNRSKNIASVVVSLPPDDTYHSQQTLTESPTFGGTKTGCTVVSGKLNLSVAVQWDGTRAVGYYQSATVINLGSVQPARCLCSVDFAALDTQTSFNTVTSFDAIPALDTVGTIGNAEGCEVVPEISVSQDGSSFGAWQPFTIGDYPGRAYKFRLKLISTVQTSYPQVTSLLFKLYLPYRSQMMPGVVLPATPATSIAFTPVFVNVPVVRATIKNAVSGDTVAITAVSATQFTIQALNGGVGVARTVDIEAVGT